MSTELEGFSTPSSEAFEKPGSAGETPAPHADSQHCLSPDTPSAFDAALLEAFSQAESGASARLDRGGAKLRRHGGLFRLVRGGLIALAALVLGLEGWVRAYGIAEPPHYEGPRPGFGAALETRWPAGADSGLVLGKHWRRERGGLHELGLSGGRWEQGYANARLCRDILARQEDHLLSFADRFLPHPAAKWLVRTGLSLQLSDLPSYFSPEEQIMLLGLAEGSLDRHPEWGPLYHRILSYHAAHDISHLLIDNPLLAKIDLVGCTAFAAWGDMTATGGVLVGRNFDFEGGEVFDRDKVVYYVWPDDGLPYVHVAWAGMAGAVTGMNRAGIYVSINAGRTDDGRRVGTPSPLVVRRILERAETIDQAVAIVAEAQVFVSDAYLIASAKERRAVVVEKSPERWALRESGDEHRILLSNHYLETAFSGDATNREQRDEATTEFRWRRLDELLARRRPALTPESCAAILRDRRLPGGQEAGFGNRNTLDALIATHSVVADLDAGVLWISVGPQILGKYAACHVYRSLDLGPEAAFQWSPAPDGDLPADPLAAQQAEIAAFKRALRQAQDAVADDNLPSLAAAVPILVASNPLSFQTAYYEAELAWLEGRKADARDALRRALARQPHYASLRREMSERLQSFEEEP